MDLFSYPAQIVCHPGVDAGSELSGTAVPPADDPVQKEPAVDLAHQRPSRVPLQDGGGALEGPDPSAPALNPSEYLAGVAAPVGPPGTEHVVGDQVTVVTLLATDVVGDNVDLSLPEVLRPEPQTCSRARRPLNQRRLVILELLKLCLLMLPTCHFRGIYWFYMMRYIFAHHVSLSRIRRSDR